MTLTIGRIEPLHLADVETMRLRRLTATVVPSFDCPSRTIFNGFGVTEHPLEDRPPTRRLRGIDLDVQFYIMRVFHPAGGDASPR